MMTRSRPFTTIVAMLFALAVLVHLYRLFAHFQIIVGTHIVPMWVSYIAVVVAAILSWGLFSESRR